MMQGTLQPQKRKNFLRLEALRSERNQKGRTQREQKQRTISNPFQCQNSLLRKTLRD
jgi:hypothetical protein